MASVRSFFAAILLLLFFAHQASAQTAESLPDAPRPDAGDQPAHSSNTSAQPFASSGWFGVVDPGEKFSPVSTRYKWMFWLHEQVSPISLVPVVLGAGWEQLIDGDPKYGSDSAAFGQRIGAGAIRVSTYRFFSDSLFPVLTHEDPRYFRKAYGSVQSRGLYAAEQVFIAHRDNGSTGFNYSDFFGHLAGASLTAAYYPQPSVNARVVLTSWGISFAGGACGNLFMEFWPDAKKAIAHRHKHPAT